MMRALEKYTAAKRNLYFLLSKFLTSNVQFFDNLYVNTKEIEYETNATTNICKPVLNRLAYIAK
jgi:hypothetical protein